MNYLSEQEILAINARILDMTDGRRGVRDVELLQSSVERPKSAFSGQEPYPDLYQKAAVYLESIANYHVFIDGNKRTAFVVTARFLYINGVIFSGSNNDVEHFMVEIARGKTEIEDIAKWIRKNSNKRS